MALNRSVEYVLPAYRKALAVRNMTKSYDICASTGISPGTAAALWNGSAKVSIKTIVNLRRGLILTTDELKEIFPEVYGGL